MFDRSRNWNLVTHTIPPVSAAAATRDRRSRLPKSHDSLNFLRSFVLFGFRCGLFSIIIVKIRTGYILSTHNHTDKTHAGIHLCGVCV